MNAYAYYDENGALKEYITDPSIRQGNNGYNAIKVYWHNSPMYETIGYRFHKIGSKNPGIELEVSQLSETIKIPAYKDRDLKFFVSGKEYDIFSIPVNNLENGGYELVITVYTSYKTFNLAMITFNVENGIAVYDYGVTKSQFDSLFNKVSNTYTKSQTRSLIKKPNKILTGFTQTELSKDGLDKTMYLIKEFFYPYEQIEKTVDFEFESNGISFIRMIFHVENYFTITYVDENETNHLVYNGSWLNSNWKKFEVDKDSLLDSYISSISNELTRTLRKVIFENTTGKTLSLAYSDGEEYHSNKNKSNKSDFIHQKKRYYESIEAGQKLTIADLIFNMEYFDLDSNCSFGSKGEDYFSRNVYNQTINREFAFISGDYYSLPEFEELFNAKEQAVAYEFGDYMLGTRKFYICNKKSKVLENEEVNNWTDEVYAVFKIYILVTPEENDEARISIGFGDVYK